jgi:HSP20 family molecular chaperone IbpA
MSANETKALKPKEKEEVTSAAEQTRQGFVFTPTVDIFETDYEISVLADLPGVNPDNLDINIKENILSLSGTVDSPESENEIDIIKEYRVGRYFREFTLSDFIDQSKINAELKNGVLRLKLPKAEKAAPRKITVKAA